MFTLYITADLLVIAYSRSQGHLPHNQGFADEVLLLALGCQMVPAGGGHGQAVQVQTLRPLGFKLGVWLLKGLEAEAELQERCLLS